MADVRLSPWYCRAAALLPPVCRRVISRVRESGG